MRITWARGDGRESCYSADAVNRREGKPSRVLIVDDERAMADMVTDGLVDTVPGGYALPGISLGS